MTAPIEAILDAWDKETGDGREEDRARRLAKDYVDANPGDFAYLDGKTVDELVGLVDFHRETADLARDRGLDDAAVVADSQKLLVDVFLLGRVPKRHNGGPVDTEVVNLNG